MCGKCASSDMVFGAVCVSHHSTFRHTTTYMHSDECRHKYVWCAISTDLPISCSDTSFSGFDEAHTGQACVVEYMRQYSSPTTGCRHAHYWRRKHWNRSGNQVASAETNSCQYLREHWKCKHCKFNLCTGSSNAPSSIYMYHTKAVHKVWQQGHIYCTLWTGSNGDFRYNIIMKFVTYQTRTTHTKKKEKEKFNRNFLLICIMLLWLLLQPAFDLFLYSLSITK